MLKTIFWTVFLLITEVLWAALPERTYSIFGYPKNEMGCDATAEALGKRFADATGVNILVTSCDKDNGNTYEISLTYSAQVPPVMVTTELDGLYRGTYPSLEACNSTLSEETAHFEKATGLKSVVNYCYVDTSSETTNLPVILRIDGFGNTKVTPREDNYILTGSTPADSDALSSQIFDRAKQFGLDISRFVFRREGDFFKSAVLRYYGGHRAPLVFQKIADYGISDKKCEDAQNELEPIFTKANVGNLATFCTYAENSPEQVELYSYRLETVSTLSYSWYTKNYKSLDECNSDRQNVLDLYVKTLKRPAIATLCQGATSSEYQIRVFEAYPL